MGVSYERNVTNMNPGISKIAKQLSLSPSTVSRAISGSRPVKPENRDKVLQYLKRSNGTGWGLPQQNRKTQFVIGAGVPGRPSFFWDVAISGMKSAVSTYPAGLVNLEIMRYSGDTRTEQETLRVVDALENTGADAYMLVPFTSDRVVERLEHLAERAPVAVFNDYLDFKGRFLYAGPDHRGDGRRAAEILLEHLSGECRVLIISPPLDQSSVAQRVEGFRSVIEKSPRAKIVGGIAIETYNSLLPSIIARKIDSLGLGRTRFNSVYVADGAIHLVGSALQKLGILKDVYCVGHEYSRRNERLFEKGLHGAYISQDIFYQGFITVKRLAEYLAGNDGQPGSVAISGYDVGLMGPPDGNTV